MAQYIETASDLNVEGIDFYVKQEADGYFYSDEACTQKVNAADAVHFFGTNDIIINDNGVKSRPFALKVVEGVATLSYVVTSVVSEKLVLVAKEVVSYDEPATDEETPYTEETVVDNGGSNDTGLNNGGSSEPVPAPGPEFEQDPGPEGETGN